MKSKITVLGLALTLLFTLISGVAEARMGGGRSFGSRGSRSVAPRPYQSSPNAPYGSQRPEMYRRDAMNPGGFGANSYRRPGLFTGLASGIAGGFLGSMLFRGLGFAGPMGMGGGGGGFGFLELILLVGAGYLIFKWLKARNTQSQSPLYAQSSTAAPLPFQSGIPQSAPNSFASESDAADTLRGYDGRFDLAQFKESRTDDFFKLQAAFMNRELDGVRTLLAPEIYTQLNSDLNQMKAEKKINRLENISVRESELVESWAEYGKAYATLKLRANLLDYTTDESGTLVSGSKTEPVKFEEYWTFVTDISNGLNTSWKLSAIENA